MIYRTNDYSIFKRLDFGTNIIDKEAFDQEQLKVQCDFTRINKTFGIELRILDYQRGKKFFVQDKLQFAIKI
ncbi:MAG: hypothetical protein QNJ41_25360 [Xenococcaceae cyanobacterium MO_188.B32]|nr:hypothetical protein [Xenococcaceae cyanobacterium MO_188.B32]